MISFGFRTRCVIVAVALVGVATLMGCAGSASDTDGGGVSDRTVQGSRDIQSPAAPDLTSAEGSVRSYLNWLSYSYQLANSEVASATMTPFEWVRVDAYIELNRQQDRGIEQALDVFELVGSVVQEPTATVSAREAWIYRYFSLSSQEYISDSLFTSYDTTYTVVHQADGAWLVDRVDAVPRAEVE